MTLAPPPSFAPPGWLVNAHLQSIVPSLRLRRPLVARRARQMLACAQTQIVECGARVTEQRMDFGAALARDAVTG